MAAARATDRNIFGQVCILQRVKRCSFFSIPVLIMCLACSKGSKPVASTSPVTKEAEPVPLEDGMASYLLDMAPLSAQAGFSPVINPGAGVSMYVPAGFEWYSPANVLGAFSNVIKMIEASAPRKNAPIQVFYALPDLLREVKFPTTLDVDIYPAIPYEQFLGRMASHAEWIKLPLLRTSMGAVPVYQREDSATEMFSDGDPLRFKLYTRRYALCWKSGFVLVTTVIPAPVDARLRPGLEEAIRSLRVFPKAQGELTFPPEGPKAARYEPQGGTGRPFRPDSQGAVDPRDELDRINEFNRRNQQPQQQPQQEAPPAEAPGSVAPPAGEGDEQSGE